MQHQISHPKRLYLLTGVLTLGLCAPSAVPPVWAQPPERGAVTERPPSSRAVAAAVVREWKELREEVGVREVTEPAQTIARYQEFYEARGYQSPDVAVQIASLVAQMHWRGLNDRAKALETYEWGLQEYGRHPAGARLKQEWELLQGTQKLDIAKVGETKGGATALLALIERLSAAQVSNEQADEWWRESGVSAEELLRALQTSGVVEKRTEAARPRLMGLVARHGAELVAEPEKLPERLQYLLADYYVSAKDARAEGIYRHLLAKLKEQSPKAQQVRALWGLYEYYLAVGQPEVAADVLASAGEYTTHPYELGNAAIYAARLYRATGQSEKAQAAYQSARQAGFGWGVGVANYDQASLLIAQGNHEEARALLKVPVTGQYAEQIQVALLSLLGLSYYETGDFEEAKNNSQQAVQQAGKLELLKNEGLEVQVNVAEAVRYWSAQWAKEPMIIEPRELRIIISGDVPLDEVETRRILVRTFSDVPLSATIDSAEAKVRVSDQSHKSGYFVQKEVVLEVVPRTLSGSLDATLTVSSPMFPTFQARLPIHVEMQKLIQSSSSTVFFGLVKTDVPTTQTLTLSASVPFRVVNVKTDSALLEVKSLTVEAARQHSIELKLTPSKVGQIYNGTVRIQTDVPGQEVIEVPYVARVE